MHHVKYNAVAGGQMALFVWTKTWHHLPLHCLQKFTQSTLALVVCICLTTTKFYHKPRYSLGKALSVFILTQKTCPRLASIYANNLIKSWDFILQQVSWWPRGSLHMGTDNNKHTYCRHFLLLLFKDWGSAKQMTQCLYSLPASYNISIQTQSILYE